MAKGARKVEPKWLARGRGLAVTQLGITLAQDETGAWSYRLADGTSDGSFATMQEARIASLQAAERAS